MSRRRCIRLALYLPALFCLVMPLVACSGGGEQQIIQKYFSAAKLRDQTTLGNMATVSFDPQTDGTVQSMKVASVTEEQRRVIPLKDLNKKHADAKKADEEFSKRKKAYQDENIEAIDRVIKAERSGGKLKGKDLEVQAAWTKWRDEVAEHSKRVADTRIELANARGTAEISLYDARSPVEVSDYIVELFSKDVTVAATVRAPDGQAGNRDLIITMQRARVKLEDGKERTGRWIITGIRDAAAGAKTS
ncbi:MAG: hypothetical protein HYX76_13200 [Acidobacteria bacterium]|nr:hypothetical protein [Acidobacteriota bacterium]